MRRTGSGRSGPRSSGGSSRDGRLDPAFAVCIDARDQSDLTRGRAYRVIDDPMAAEVRMIRVVDDTGEDYLYPRGDFRVIRLPADLAEGALRFG